MGIIITMFAASFGVTLYLCIYINSTCATQCVISSEFRLGMEMHVHIETIVGYATQLLITLNPTKHFHLQLTVEHVQPTTEIR